MSSVNPLSCIWGNFLIRWDEDSAGDRAVMVCSTGYSSVLSEVAKWLAITCRISLSSLKTFSLESHIRSYLPECIEDCESMAVQGTELTETICEYRSKHHVGSSIFSS